MHQLNTHRSVSLIFASSSIHLSDLLITTPVNDKNAEITYQSSDGTRGYAHEGVASNNAYEMSSARSPPITFSAGNDEMSSFRAEVLQLFARNVAD